VDADYMYRMDHAAKFNVEGGVIKGLSKLPSEYIKKQCLDDLSRTIRRPSILFT